MLKMYKHHQPQPHQAIVTVALFEVFTNQFLRKNVIAQE